MKGRTVNRNELAQIFGVAVMTVDQWVRREMPVIEKGGRGVSWKFDTAAVARWRTEEAAKSAAGDLSKATLDEVRLRKEVAHTVIAEIEAEEKSNSVLTTESLILLYEPMSVAIRSTLLNLPSKLTQYVEPDALELIEYEIRLALEELSRYDIEIPEIQDDTGGDADGSGET